MTHLFETRQDNGTLHLTMTRAWDVDSAGALADALKQFGGALTHISRADITLAPGVPSPDSNSVYLLHKYILKDRISPENVTLSGFNDHQLQFIRHILHISAETKAETAPPPERNIIFRNIAGIGRTFTAGTAQAMDIIAFFGRTCTVFGRGLRSPRHLRLSSIVRHIDETGIGAAPIVALLAFLISVVLSYQAATQLKPYGAEIFTVDLTAISILREMGVMLTAIIVAGRSGSAFAAEIGVMRLREETDALETLGMDPYETLVLPRVLALMFTLPLLTFLANIVGLVGGGLLALALLDISVTQYINRIADAVTVTTFLIGMVKAPVFALLIAIVGCWQGMRASGSAESVGRMTTTSVVRAIFLVLLADALFSILFSHLGI